MTPAPPTRHGKSPRQARTWSVCWADAIVRDILPALIHAAERRPTPIGFEQTDVDLATDTERATETDED